MFLMMCPALGAFIAYLYAASKLDRDIRARHPANQEKIFGAKDTHASSNVIRLLFRRKEIGALGDEEVSRQLDLVRYSFWAFLLGLVFAFLFA